MIVSGAEAIRCLSAYHPIFIEGPGRDKRDAYHVANMLYERLSAHLALTANSARHEPIIIIQGDPYRDTGISAITRSVASRMGIGRCLICLDENIDAQHAMDADREAVVCELRYSDMTALLLPDDSACAPLLFQSIDAAVRSGIVRRNQERAKCGQDPLADYYYDYAMLQEVSA